jgi:hypothetical protein
MRETVLRTLLVFTALGWLSACEELVPPEPEKPVPVVVKPVKKAPVAAPPVVEAPVVKKKPVIDFDDGGSGGGGWS